MTGYHVPALHNHCQFVVKMSTTTAPVPSLILVEYIVKVIFAFIGIYVSVIKIVPSNCTSGAVRLVNGNSDSEGIVEVCYQGVWTAVDGVYWDYCDARVLCRQLGYHDKCE